MYSFSSVISAVVQGTVLKQFHTMGSIHDRSYCGSASLRRAASLIYILTQRLYEKHRALVMRRSVIAANHVFPMSCTSTGRNNGLILLIILRVYWCLLYSRVRCSGEGFTLDSVCGFIQNFMHLRMDGRSNFSTSVQRKMDLIYSDMGL